MGIRTFVSLFRDNKSYLRMVDDQDSSGEVNPIGQGQRLQKIILDAEPAAMESKRKDCMESYYDLLAKLGSVKSKHNIRCWLCKKERLL